MIRGEFPGVVLVVRKDGQIVGYTFAEESNEGVFNIVEITVESSSQKQGVGTALFAALLRKLTSIPGVKTIKVLDVSLSGQTARMAQKFLFKKDVGWFDVSFYRLDLPNVELQRKLAQPLPEVSTPAQQKARETQLTELVADILRRLKREEDEKQFGTAIELIREAIVEKKRDLEELGIDEDLVIRRVIRGLPEPNKEGGRVADFIGKDFILAVRHALENQGYPDGFVKSIVDLLQDPEISGAVWTDPKTGQVEGSRLLIQLLGRLSTLVESERHQGPGSGVRESLVHEYMHQILSETLTYVEKEGLRRRIEELRPDFLEKFLTRYGVNNVEEVLAKFLSLEFGSRYRSFEAFGRVRKLLESFLEEKRIYEITIPNKKSFRQTVRDMDGEFFERFEQRFGTRDIKTIFLKYRQLKLLSEDGRLDEEGKADLELFNRIQMEMDMNLGEKVSLIDLVRGNTPNKILARLIKQVRHKVDLKKGERIDQKIRNMAIDFGPLRLRHLEDSSQRAKESVESAA